MTRKLALITTLVALVATPTFAQTQRLTIVDANGNLDALIRQHAAANNLPEDLVRRVIKRESGGKRACGERGQLRADADQARDGSLHGIHRQRRWPARCQHQYDLCGEISGRRLPARQRQSQPRSALLCCRLLLCCQGEGSLGNLARAGERRIHAAARAAA